MPVSYLEPFAVRVSAPSQLSASDQREVLDFLRPLATSMEDPEETEAACDLLRRLRARPEVTFEAATAIDELLDRPPDRDPTPPAPQPPPAAPIPPPPQPVRLAAASPAGRGAPGPAASSGRGPGPADSPGRGPRPDPPSASGVERRRVHRLAPRDGVPLGRRRDHRRAHRPIHPGQAHAGERPPLDRRRHRRPVDRGGGDGQRGLLRSDRSSSADGAMT